MTYSKTYHTNGTRESFPSVYELQMTDLPDEPLPEYNPPVDREGKPIFPGDVLCYLQDGIKLLVTGIGDGCFYYVHDSGNEITNSVMRKHPMFHGQPSILEHYKPELKTSSKVETEIAIFIERALREFIELNDNEATTRALMRISDAITDAISKEGI